MGAGCVILALHHEQDIFRMGGLKKSMPTVFWCFLLGALALAACPGTAGFFSKDEVLLGLYAQGTALGKALWVLAEVTSLITAIYVFRLIFLVFFGEEKTKAHPIPKIMTWSIVPLAFLSLFGGILNLPADLGGPGWLHGQLAGHGIAGKALGGPEFFVQIMTAVVFAAGLAATWYLYVINPRLRESMIQRSSRLLDFLYQAWYLDKAYYFLFVKPYGKLANMLWKRVDVGVIDAAVDGTGAGLARSATFLRGAVTGKASTYITATVVGAAAIMFYFAWRVW
jgi:NADH-quinone oxidoreductase subunit L